MPEYQTPTESKKWIQPNKGDVFGNLFATFNMDFDSSLGKARVAPRARINTDDGDDADLGVPLAFVRSSADGTDRYWALTSTGTAGALFKTAGTDPSAAFTQDAIASSPTTNVNKINSDMVDFEGALIVSLTTDISRLSTTWTASWWQTTLGRTALTNVAHPLHVTKKTNTLLIGDGQNIHAVDKNSNVRTNRVILPADFQAVWIRSNQQGTWIGARNTVGGEAEAFFWDESSENYNFSYKLKSDMAFAGVIKDGIPYTVNGEGQLLGYTGSGFEEVAVFPNFSVPNKRLNDGNTVRRNVHRNGMAVIEGKISILISSLINNIFSNMMENFPSGIWSFDEKQGLRHKYALSLYDGTENDYGAFILSEVGALIPTTASQGLFLAGALIHDTASVSSEAIFYRDVNDSIVKRGHFVTSTLESSAFEDVFQDLLATFKRFRSANDRIIFKYRVIKNSNYPIQGDGTWSSTTVFTTTTSLANASAGDEAMIVRGTGSGATARISTITESAGTYTVTLAEAITGVSGTMQFLIGDWTECAIVSAQSIERQEFDLDVPGTWIQLKVELRSASGSAGAGDSPELEMVRLRSIGEAVI